MLSLLALSGGFTESSTDPPAVPPANRQVGGAAGGSVEGALNGHVRTVKGCLHYDTCTPYMYVVQVYGVHVS